MTTPTDHPYPVSSFSTGRLEAFVVYPFPRIMRRINPETTITR